MEPRWNDYLIDTGFERFWGERLSGGNERVCVITGSGFDPRATLAIARIERAAKDAAQVQYVAFTFKPPTPIGHKADAVVTLSTANAERLGRLKAACLAREEVVLYDASGHAAGGRATLQSVRNVLPQLGRCRDVVVDISGMPRTIFYPLLAYLCREADAGKINNLHVAVSESPGIDTAIQGREYGSADYVHTFRLQTSPPKLVWLPVVTENDGIRLQKVHDLIKGDCIEICPVVPFPSGTLRRSDNILMSLREVLFENFAISKNNILLCDERNPFDVYRKVLQIDDYYRDRVASLPALRNVTTVVSPPSSKMLSLGTLLAAIERKLPVCHVGARAYAIDDPARATGDLEGVTTTEVWLTGEPYAL
jgi:hypothetical protein